MVPKRLTPRSPPSDPGEGVGQDPERDPHDEHDDTLDEQAGHEGSDLSSPWSLGVFLGFATSLAANDPVRPNTVLTAVLFLAGFAAGVGLWVGIVAVLGRGVTTTQRAQALLTAEADTEQVKLDAARLRLERARIEQQIAELERDGRRMADKPEGGAEP